MSFTGEVRQEVCRNVPEGDEARAELSALIQLTASLSISAGGMTIVSQTGSAAVSRCIFRLLKQRYTVQVDMGVKKRMNLRKNRVYLLRIHGDTVGILQDLGIYSARGLRQKPLQKIVQKDTCARAYLAGAFLAQGSVNSPKTTNYHLEIQAGTAVYADFLIGLMDRFALHARKIQRRGRWVVYLKQAEKIADFLRIMEADENLLAFEDTRISRDLTNSVQRLNNVDVANEIKSMKASQAQLADIQVLQEHGLVQDLDEKLQTVIALRQEFPEATLNELADKICQRTGTPVSKSGLKHRFDRIHAMAERLR